MLLGDKNLTIVIQILLFISLSLGQNPASEQKERIEKTAQMILYARNLYPDSSLADLYDELIMPYELRKAHQENDKAVMEAYGFDLRTMTESECVEELMKLYQALVEYNIELFHIHAHFCGLLFCKCQSLE